MRKLCWFAWPFGLAVALSVWGLSGKWGLALGFCALLAGLLLPIAFPRPGRHLRWCCFGLALGLFWCFGRNSLVSSSGLTEGRIAGTFSGVVTDHPSETDYGWRLPVELEAEGESIPTLLYLSELDPAPVPGDTFTCVAECSPAELSLRMRDYSLSGSCKYLSITGHEDSIRFLPARCSHWLQESLAGLFHGDGGGLIIAMVTGDQSHLSDSAAAVLRACGLSHIIAVSGLHMSLLAYGCLRLFPGGKGRLSVIPLLGFFALMVNTPSCWRALFMFLLTLIAPLFGREEDGATSLAFAFVVILMKNPYTIASVGFQLSFLSVLGILVVTEPLSAALRKLWNRRNLSRFVKRSLMTVGELLALSLGANFFLLPLLTYYFDQVSLISPLVNLLVNWMLPFLFLGGLAAGLLAPLVPPLAALFSAALRLPAEGLLSLSGLMARIPFGTVSLSGLYGIVFLASLYLTAALLFSSKALRRRWYFPMGGILLVLFGAVFLQTRSLTRSDLTLQILDVGQGQSILLRSEGETAAIDCGGDSSPGVLLAQSLLSTGETTLDILILTHFDSDHVNGMETLFAQIRVEQIYIPLAPNEPDWQTVLLTLAAEGGAVVNYVTEPLSLSVGGTALTLYPSEDTSSDNSSSLTVLAERSEFRFLTTGDLDCLGELALLSKYDLPDIDLLSVGHHGSSSSTSKNLLDAVRPETAVISVGENPYGHPAAETLARLQERNITVYRTDQNGTITIRVEDQEVSHGGTKEKNNEKIPGK